MAEGTYYPSYYLLMLGKLQKINLITQLNGHFGNKTYMHYYTKRRFVKFYYGKKTCEFLNYCVDFL